MSDKKEQVKPLAPASHRLNIDSDIGGRSDFFSPDLSPELCRRRQNCIKLCGCSAAVLLIAVTVLLVLMFTVFHVKDPSLSMNSVNVRGVDELNGSSTGAGRIVTFDFGLSVKNPNAAAFKFTNTTTYVYYGGSLVGEETGPAGRAPARKRVAVGVSVGVTASKIMEVDRLRSDLGVGVLSISSYTRISGKVKITREIKKSMVVKLNCTMNLSVTRQEIQDLICT